MIIPIDWYFSNGFKPPTRQESHHDTEKLSWQHCSGSTKMWYIGWSTCCTFAVHWQMKPSSLFSLRAFGHSSKAWVSLSLNIVFECFWYILMILKSYPVIWSSQLLDRWRTEGCLPFSGAHHIFCSRTLNWQCGWILLCHIPFCFGLIREAVRWQTHAQNFNDLPYHPCTLHSIFAEHYLPHDYTL